MADNKWSAFGAFLCGAALGALAGIYFAPKSGQGDAGRSERPVERRRAASTEGKR